MSNAHKRTVGGHAVFSAADREQITVAAFLNMFIAWESFLESSVAEFMIGKATINGRHPKTYASPKTIIAARDMVVGTNRYFDYSDPDRVRTLIRLYFRKGYPYEPHLSGVAIHLKDCRTLRNSAAHITVSTQQALETVAQRIFAVPHIGIRLYQVLSAIDPRTPGETVFTFYKNVLLTAAELIARG